jgi:hypothetical protein
MTSQETPASRQPGDPLPDRGEPPSFDSSRAHPARIYDYWLGGKDNYEADRVAAELAIQADPAIVPGVRANRAFLRRAVQYLAGEAGIRQFLDIGTGLPTAENTHQVAQAAAADSRVVYIDNDPIVLAHARALLASSPQGATAYIQADARDPGAILREAATTLDLTQPVAVMLLMIMQYIPDSDNPCRVISALMDAMPAGSYLTISTVTRDIVADRITEGAARLNARMGSASISLRTREEIAGFFDGLNLVDPGLVPLPEWRTVSTPTNWMPAYAGMARKP